MAGVASAQDRDCSDFDTQQEAQPTSTSRATRRRTTRSGWTPSMALATAIACESLPSGGGSSSSSDDDKGNDKCDDKGDDRGQVRTKPKGSVDTGDGSTAPDDLTPLLALTEDAGGRRGRRAPSDAPAAHHPLSMRLGTGRVRRALGLALSATSLVLAAGCAGPQSPGRRPPRRPRLRQQSPRPGPRARRSHRPAGLPPGSAHHPVDRRRHRPDRSRPEARRHHGSSSRRLYRRLVHRIPDARRARARRARRARRLEGRQGRLLRPAPHRAGRRRSPSSAPTAAPRRSRCDASSSTPRTVSRRRRSTATSTPPSFG